MSPFPLPVAVPPLWPEEATLRGSVGLIVLVAVRVRLGHRENSVLENFFQLGGEECHKAAAGLGHLRVRLWSETEQMNVSEILTNDDCT